jgi:hypothetical protein
MTDSRDHLHVLGRHYYVS